MGVARLEAGSGSVGLFVSCDFGECLDVQGVTLFGKRARWMVALVSLERRQGCRPIPTSNRASRPLEPRALLCFERRRRWCGPFRLWGRQGRRAGRDHLARSLRRWRRWSLGSIRHRTHWRRWCMGFGSRSCSRPCEPCAQERPDHERPGQRGYGPRSRYAQGRRTGGWPRRSRSSKTRCDSLFRGGRRRGSQGFRLENSRDPCRSVAFA